MADKKYILHGFFRSSTSFRVRIALNLKGIPFDQKTYILRKGEQRGPDYLELNNQGLVPALELPCGTVLTQSMAILDYLDATHPAPRFLPEDPVQAAYVRSLANRIACDIHPINNLRILGYLKDPLGHSEEEIADWFCHWMNVELASLEKTLEESSFTGKFCFGDEPGLADMCLIPQIVNGRRFNASVDHLPTLKRIFEHALTLDAFKGALPENQPDAV
ncbi:MAG: maleylacetoacetate isomerase [Sneathiella sp.]|nr:maleylacetoacetate isomerase [Sneathiella sp.]